jgi:hypothetical protein
MNMVKATNLSSATDTLADGALVLHVSIQRVYVYVQVFNPTTARMTTRRYSHDKMVKVQS